MPLLNGFGAARQLSKLVPESERIFLTMQPARPMRPKPPCLGLWISSLNAPAVSELSQAIPSVLQRRYYLTLLITKDVLDSVLKPSTGGRGMPTTLTVRRREVLQLVAEGRSTKEVATILSVL